MPLTWTQNPDKTASWAVIAEVQTSTTRMNRTELVVYGPGTEWNGTWALVVTPAIIAQGRLSTVGLEATRAEACEMAVQWFEAQAAKLRPHRDPP